MGGAENNPTVEMGTIASPQTDQCAILKATKFLHLHPSFHDKGLCEAPREPEEHLAFMFRSKVSSSATRVTASPQPRGALSIVSSNGASFPGELNGLEAPSFTSALSTRGTLFPNALCLWALVVGTALRITCGFLDRSLGAVMYSAATEVTLSITYECGRKTRGNSTSFVSSTQHKSFSASQHDMFFLPANCPIHPVKKTLPTNPQQRNTTSSTFLLFHQNKRLRLGSHALFLTRDAGSTPRVPPARTHDTASRGLCVSRLEARGSPSAHVRDNLSFHSCICAQIVASARPAHLSHLDLSSDIRTLPH